jgi:hypothetical protein
MTNYDYVLLGSSPLVLFEAIFLKKQKKKVILIEQNPFVGGAWHSINLKNFINVENAIHYFLHYNIDSNFLEKNLKLNVVKVLNKKIIKNKKQYPSTKKSFYFKYGLVEIEKISKILIKKYNIRIVKNTNIEKIKIIKKKKIIEIKAKNKKNHKLSIFHSKKILITSGSKIKNIYKDNERVKIYNIKLLRPTIHLVIQNVNKFKNYGELIFKNNNLIKYVHDVTFYAKKRLIALKKKNLSILIVALKHNVRFKNEIFEHVLINLKKNCILDCNVKIVEKKWTNVFLPSISLSQLNKIKAKFADFVEIMYTENFIETVKLKNNTWKRHVHL